VYRDAQPIIGIPAASIVSIGPSAMIAAAGHAVERRDSLEIA
jgi:hypothetical protein